MDMFGGVAEFHDIQLACPALSSAVVQGNQQHLRQVIYNLLDNALKFTPAGGRVTVQLHVDSPASFVVFSVRDTGPGISPEDLTRVFDRFFQSHRPRTGTPEKRGTGLGLSICQAIVKAHDGTIEVESQVGVGTKFTVRLPSSGSQSEPPEPRTHDHRKAGRQPLEDKPAPAEKPVEASSERIAPEVPEKFPLDPIPPASRSLLT